MKWELRQSQHKTLCRKTEAPIVDCLKIRPYFRCHSNYTYYVFGSCMEFQKHKGEEVQKKQQQHINEHSRNTMKKKRLTLDFRQTTATSEAHHRRVRSVQRV